MLKFRCPHCQQVYEAPDNMAGQAMQCQKCNGMLRAPSAPAAAPRPAPQQRQAPARPQTPVQQVPEAVIPPTAQPTPAVPQAIIHEVTPSAPQPEQDLFPELSQEDFSEPDPFADLPPSEFAQPQPLQPQGRSQQSPRNQNGERLELFEDTATNYLAIAAGTLLCMLVAAALGYVLNDIGFTLDTDKM